MFSYLKKPTRSEGFHEIVDFVNGSNIRYALTKNLTIYVSLIEKFWQTATVRTFDNGEQEINATVDEEGKSLGHPSEPQLPPSIAQPTDEEPILNVASSSHQKTQTPRQALNKVTKLPHTSKPIPNVADEAVYEEWDDKVEKDATTAASLDAKSERVPTPSYDSPLLGVYTPGSDEERFEQHELTGNVQQQSNDPPLSRGHTLGSGEDSIELIKELMKTCTKLVKKLEKKKKKARTPPPIKRRLFKFRVESSAKENLNEEDPSKQRRTRKNVQTYTRRKRAVSIGSGGISTVSRLVSIAEESVSTAGASMPVSMLQEQDRLGYEAAVRLQE
nr:hypothetical protein [Tanacetum cinerariifolium]